MAHRSAKAPSGKWTKERSEKRRLQRHRIEPHDYHELVLMQGDTCAICGCVPSGVSGPMTKLNIDHCHTTGRVRGLLCRNCNVALGLMKDDPDRLEAAARYLRRTGYVK